MPSNHQLIAALALLPSAMSHLCVWAPMQRGDFSIDTPGSHDCYRKDGPCGGEDAGTTVTALNGGSSFDVHFQQNLNHYDVDTPGSLVIDYAPTADPTEDDFISLDGGEAFADYNAMNMITETNFTRTVTIPDADVEAAVIRVRYISNNPGENDRGETFYQCSDVSITSSATSGVAPVVKKPAPKLSSSAHSVFTYNNKAGDDQGGDDQGEDHSCCAPSHFSITYYSNPNLPNSAGGQIFYDADLQMMRVDYTAPSVDYSMYLNFSSGIEWLFDPRDMTCEEYGLDPWVDWCFGKTGYSETFSGSGECGDPINEACLGFTNGDWLFAATAEECFPALINGTNGNAPHEIVYINGDSSEVDPVNFFPPCQATKKVGGYAPLDIAAVKATPAFHKGSHRAAQN